MSCQYFHYIANDLCEKHWGTSDKHRSIMMFVKKAEIVLVFGVHRGTERDCLHAYKLSKPVWVSLRTLNISPLQHLISSLFSEEKKRCLRSEITDAWKWLISSATRCHWSDIFHIQGSYKMILQNQRIIWEKGFCVKTFFIFIVTCLFCFRLHPLSHLGSYNKDVFTFDFL